MPPLYVAVHLLLATICVWVALRLPPRSRVGYVLAGLGIALVVLGFVVERRSDWAWSFMGLGWADAVYFTNLSLPAVAVLVAVLWRAAGSRGARVRAALLSVAVVGVSLWSLRWYFAPLPAQLTGAVDSKGLCRQTTEQSCGAAAAVTLLHQHGIRTTEQEMARLCLTREGFGTPTLGIYRGVALRARGQGLRARLVTANPTGDLSQLVTPCIVSVGLRPDAPPEVSEEMQGYGWTPGLRHAVVFLGRDAATGKLRVADPSFGHEQWSAKGLEWIWDGRGLALLKD